MQNKVQDDRYVPDGDVCGVCGNTIRTQTFRGTGACSDDHTKQLFGSAKRNPVHPTGPDSRDTAFIPIATPDRTNPGREEKKSRGRNSRANRDAGNVTKSYGRNPNS